MGKLTAIVKSKEVEVEYNDYDNVMVALYEHVEWGTCGGSGMCGTCICDVLQGDQYFKDPDFLEQDMLEFAGKPNSRLGCQLSLEGVPSGKVKIRVNNDRY